LHDAVDRVLAARDIRCTVASLAMMPAGRRIPRDGSVTMIDVDGEHTRIAQLAPENADGVARFVHGMHWWLACRD
jgi:hypothetical protein